MKFLIEGEEEIGGEAIDKYVYADAGQKLDCDAVVISDSSMYAPGQPSLLYGLKGLAYMEIKVSGPNRDLHSGTFGGGVANPGNALAGIVASLVDPETGRITIDGFYDDVKPLEAWEREQWGELPFDEAEYREELGIDQTFGEQGFTTLERLWGRPTCDVNGLYGGYRGEGAKTVASRLGGRQGLDAAGAESGSRQDRPAVHRARRESEAQGSERRGQRRTRRRAGPDRDRGGRLPTRQPRRRRIPGARAHS